MAGQVPCPGVAQVDAELRLTGVPMQQHQQHRDRSRSDVAVIAFEGVVESDRRRLRGGLMSLGLGQCFSISLQLDAHRTIVARRLTALSNGVVTKNRFAAPAQLPGWRAICALPIRLRSRSLPPVARCGT